jgi:hypothetical protein
MRDKSMMADMLFLLFGSFLYLLLGLPLRCLRSCWKASLDGSICAATRCIAPLSVPRITFIVVLLLCIFEQPFWLVGAALIIASNSNHGLYAVGHDTPPTVRWQIVAAFLVGFGSCEEIAKLCGRTTA